MIAFRNRLFATLAGATLILAPAPASAGTAQTTSPSAAMPATRTVQAAPVCEVSWDPMVWGSFAVVMVTISNRGPVAINTWSLTFTLPGNQEIVEAWGATYQPAKGPVVAVDVGTNAFVDVGGSVMITFFIKHNGSTAMPDSFKVNGHECGIVPPSSSTG